MVVMEFASKNLKAPFVIQSAGLKIYAKTNSEVEIGEVDGVISSDDHFIVVQTKLNAKVSLTAKII